MIFKNTVKLSKMEKICDEVIRYFIIQEMKPHQYVADHLENLLSDIRLAAKFRIRAKDLDPEIIRAFVDDAYQFSQALCILSKDGESYCTPLVGELNNGIAWLLENPEYIYRELNK